MINLDIFSQSSTIRTSHLILNTGQKNHIAFSKAPQRAYFTVCPILYGLGLEGRWAGGKARCPQLAAPCCGRWQRLSLRVHTWRGACSTHGRAPSPPADGSVLESCCKRGAVGRNVPSAVQGLERALGSLTGSFATSGNLHGSRFLLEIERTIPALLSLSLQGLPLGLDCVASSLAAVREGSVSAEQNTTEIAAQRQCSSVSRTAQRIFKKPTIL